jgi:hypothetical protein
MKKLDIPNLQPESIFEACKSRISNNIYKQKLDDSARKINEAAYKYNDLANDERLHSIDGIFPKKGEDPVVVDELKKTELTKLYTQQMVPKDSPGRFAYDQIFVAANDRCPLCSGIGQTYNLDHYLPKAHFPIYSIHPANLIPSCFECNIIKSNNVSKEQENQTLHPYFDKDIYFNEKWVSAKLISINPPVLTFFVEPPVDWQPLSKARVEAHFKSYKLSKKYKVESGEELSTIVYQRKTIMQNLSPEEFQQQLSCISQSPALNPNHWKRVMYFTLSQDIHFLSEKF